MGVFYAGAARIKNTHTPHFIEKAQKNRPLKFLFLSGGYSLVKSLLSTQFTIPPFGINRVERECLQQKADDGLSEGRRLFLVCAPAGYGKTSLVGECSLITTYLLGWHFNFYFLLIFWFHCADS